MDIDLASATDDEIMMISRESGTGLSLEEMHRVREHFSTKGRSPTDVELQSIGQAWSEHCCYKSSRVFLKEYVFGINTRHVIDRGDAGVMEFDRDHAYALRIESHNHPSAVEPYGGAATGIGGIIRDVLCMGAQPIALVDPLYFGPLDLPFRKLPEGIKHPKYLFGGVVAGIRDYGNRVGLPTVSGGVWFDESYIGNCLVNVGCIGIADKKDIRRNAVKGPGDVLVLVGGRTGRDGIHGATFSSGELTHQSQTISSAAVQIGNPIQEKKMLDTILQARDKNLYSAITDCGAGGLSSAVGEMGVDLGAKVYLDKVPLKYSGLSYMEIWVSESQERMVLSVPKEKIGALKEVFGAENVDAAVIGEFTDSGRLKLYYQDNLVCDLGMRFLHQGLPLPTKKAEYAQPEYKEPKLNCPPELTKYLYRLLSHYDIASKEWVIRQYDHEVQ
ncbi:MAG TPA: phosphoribosylformylglycinamidine synthase II, partial [Thermoplasmata archaeon]|nr:phosphoribosylformylglycinamidine synthase II [Thermoplasmata archaeon]